MISEDNIELPSNPNVPASKQISALKPDVVHKICADRVVGNLAIAMKELVENSIDAGATNISVRIKCYGLESVEVADNGKGVQESDFEALTQTYHTSKLSEFSDLDSIGTFGFRGEALSSLCRLCEGLVVITRHATSQLASRLTYDSTGKLIHKIPCAGEIGTKVTLQKLFSPLPVRRKVFAAKCQQEFNKAMHLLHAYCIIAEGVRIQIHHQRAEGKDWSMLVDTHGGKLRDNLGSVVGYKCLSQLLPLPGSAHQGSAPAASRHPHFQLRGYMSSCAHGAGRRTPDKQYFFINGRPCDLPKVSRLVNQVYRLFNKHQAPLVVLNVETIEKSLVDVNLAPDKRSVVLKGEGSLLDFIKTTLMELYENIPSTMVLQNEKVVNFNQSSITIPIVNKSPSTFTNLGKFALKVVSKSEKKDILAEQSQDLRNLDDDVLVREVDKEILDDAPSQHEEVVPSITLLSPIPPSVLSCNSSTTPLSSKSLQFPEARDNQPANKLSSFRQSLDQFRRPHLSSLTKAAESPGVKRPGDALFQSTKYQKLDNFVVRSKKTEFSANLETDSIASYSNPDKDESAQSETTAVDDALQQEVCIDLTGVCDESMDTDGITENAPSRSLPLSYTDERREVLVPFTLDDIKTKLASTSSPHKSASKANLEKFTVSINSATNTDAEQELQREISKDMFLKMSVIGQFNKGFILAKLDSDIFIIDQHAADEKFNFEKLSKNTVLKSQRLVKPRPLNLNPVHESIFMENQDVFRRNGFDFVIDDNDEPSKKVKLTAVPTYLHSTFGMEDILELLAQIQEAPHEDCQPTRIRAILASKACRQSIMVGRALNHSAMRKLVDNLATMDHPWNCPHGRPTMRHLVNTNFAKNKLIIESEKK